MGKILHYRRRRRRNRRTARLPNLIALGFAVAIGFLWGAGYLPLPASDPAALLGRAEAGVIVCQGPSITDGDTFRCNGTRIRLAAIDAPEMPGHCKTGRQCTPGDPHAAKAYLIQLTRGPVICRQDTLDKYGRTVAHCEAGGRDLSCAMVAAGHAVERYGRLSCGK